MSKSVCSVVALLIASFSGNLSASIADDADFRIALPLTLAPAKDVNLSEIKTDRVIFAREISFAHSAKLKENLEFQGEKGRYRLESKTTLLGVVDMGPWEEDDVTPDWLFSPDNMDAGIARLMGKGDPEEGLTEQQKEERKARVKLRDALMTELFNASVFKEISLANYGEPSWLFCGEGEFENAKGKENDATICLGDSDGDGFFDRAAVATFTASSGLGLHNAAKIEGTSFSAAFEKHGAKPTGFSTVSTVFRKKKDYRFETGFARMGTVKLDLNNMAQFKSYSLPFEDGSVEQDVFGDVFKVKLADRKKHIDAQVTASSDPVTVILPYDLKFPKSSQ